MFLIEMTDINEKKKNTWNELCMKRIQPTLRVMWVNNEYDSMVVLM